MDFTKTVFAMGSAIGVRELLKAIEAVNLDGILGAVGVERKPSSMADVLPAVGIVTVSALVGAGIALLLAPSSGTKLRARLSDGLDEAKHRLSDSIRRYEASSAHPHSIS